ncbi:peptidyl-prolyl cis-trans isomerase [Parvularcula bermudensis HTCC2503]|uniref:Peptidyl-prolyl cis-trans isomerase n=1 Tax=Parvularcula bermudensis (strain ATCC BAA-594 / HTCC2503 / KCTC 12087) TaxID=314260 RepID=E0TFY3_PARBH|nr:peptidylprolyl isomerase [Parvularcula bermudensis]ADM10102.1 peptidyl-prolyl cis-trans isomerase [Parvularcula bermudensis HTCC2503]
MTKLKLELETGDVVIETFEDKAPKHVEQITSLAEDGFYDGLTFHRVIEGFMAQGGCPEGTGTGGAEENIPAEFNDVNHIEGVCSMARANDPNSASSQFFICLDDASFLDGQYTAWGRVVEGMEAVHAINKGEPPRNPTKIKSFRKA